MHLIDNARRGVLRHCVARIKVSLVPIGRKKREGEKAKGQSQKDGTIGSETRKMGSDREGYTVEQSKRRRNEKSLEECIVTTLPLFFSLFLPLTLSSRQLSLMRRFCSAYN